MSSDKPKWKPPATMLAILAAASLVASCTSTPGAAAPINPPDASTGWTTVVAAAEKEGELTVWAELSTDVATAVQAAFEQDHPEIKLTFASTPAPSLTQKVDAEQAADRGTVDFILQTDRAWHDGHTEDGYFTPIIGPDVLAADEGLRDGAAPLTSGPPVSTQVLYKDNQVMTPYFGAFGFAWNKDAVTTPPTSFEALFTDDTYDGRIGMNAPDANGVTTGLYKLISERYPDVFKRLGELNPTYYPTGSSLGQAMTAGAVDVALILSPSVLGPNGDFAYDKEFAIPAAANYGEVMASAPHPNAAQVFANWLVGASVGKVFDAHSLVPVMPIRGGNVSAKDLQPFEVPPPDQAKTDLKQINADLGR